MGALAMTKRVFFVQKGYISKDLWKALKKDICETEDEPGMLIFDN